MQGDPRVQRAVDWITTWQRFDDAEGDAPTGWPYDKREMCWGRHTCSRGAIKALKALAEIPPERRTPAVHAAISAAGTPILGDERLREALDLVASRADAQGRWKLQQTFNDRFVVPIEAKGAPSRWVTMRALEVLKPAREADTDGGRGNG